ncbi:MAG: type 4a pilus biogenesis protein PilO [Candidatus Doudnabacteria bacterium]|nr:type 4a pilus biogenesis protein PilO [Candidatus Doudnabacteria bacterium]
MRDFKSKTLVMVLLILAGFLLAYFFVFANYKNLNIVKAELTRVEQEKENLENSQRQMESFLEKYRSLDKEARQVNLALPTAPGVALLLGEMEQLAKLSGILVSSINFSELPQSDLEKVPPNSVVPIEAQLSISGSYFSFRDFLNRLENHIRILDPQLISIGVEEDNLNYEYEVKFKTYYQK